MANIKPMVDHIARAFVETTFKASWDDATGEQKAGALGLATELLAGAPVLYDALRDDKLRALLQSVEQSTECHRQASLPEAASALEQVARNLKAILGDG